MEVILRKSNSRGITKTPWLVSEHTFSFGDYIDPRYQGFYKLRVINQDVVQPQNGFPLHHHHDMEIITVILQGEVTHQDSMGNQTTIKTGEIQLMSAGSGVQHSEWNASNQLLELLQIWIFPNQKHLQPSYQQMPYQKQVGKLVPLIQPIKDNNQQNSLTIHQDAYLYLGALNQQQHLSFQTKQNHAVWIQMIAGEMNVNGHRIEAGDGLGLTAAAQLEITADKNSEWLLFELAK